MGGSLWRCTSHQCPLRLDIMTPPQHQFDRSNSVKSEQGDTATVMLEMYLEHVFRTFSGATAQPAQTKNAKVYAMEFLAVMVVLSRAIWSLDEKSRVLMELFHGPALSARHYQSNNQRGHSVGVLGYEKCFKETDLAQLILCVMRGVAKATIGVGRVWEAHGLSIAALARTLAASCTKDAIHTRQSERPEPQQLEAMMSAMAASLFKDQPPK